MKGLQTNERKVIPMIRKFDTMGRSSKYMNKKTVVEGKSFASQREAKCYLYFKGLLNSGSIVSLELQRKFVLIPSQYTTIDDKRFLVERACSYVSDFVTVDSEGNMRVYDAKGHRTEVYKIKKKLMFAVHGIRIEEI